MASVDFDIRLKKEAKTALSAYKDQSLLRRRFGDDAVKLYDLLDTGKTASELMAILKMQEERFIEIIEFMNNNAMVSVSHGGQEGAAPGEKDAGGLEAGPQEGSGASKESSAWEGEESSASSEEEAPWVAPQKKSRGDDTLSPLEKVLHDKYGSIGVQVYNLIDGEKTAEEILRQTGVSESTLVEILEFMDEQGIIKLEKPAEKEPAEEEPSEGAAEPAQEPRFKPITEEEPEETPFVPPKVPKKEEKPEEKKHEPEFAEDIIPVDVPQMGKMGMVQRALMLAELSTKFPKGAKQLVDSVDGNRDFIDLSLATGISFFDIDAVLAYFGKKGFVSFRQLSREEIKRKYGEDGFAIYKRFGREGLLLYEMIGKEASLREIILKSRFDPDRAIDILIFIHKVLGLDVPIDRNIIYRQLGLRR